MKRLIHALLVLVLLGGFLAWWFSPKQVVKRRVGKLMQLMSFEEGQGRMARQSGVYALHGLLAQEIELSSTTHPDVSGMFDRQQVESGFNWLAAQAEESSFDVNEIKGIRINEPFAEVDLMVDGVMKLRGRARIEGRFAVFLVWENQENQWVLNHARWEKAD